MLYSESLELFHLVCVILYFYFSFSPWQSPFWLISLTTLNTSYDWDHAVFIYPCVTDLFHLS